MKSWKISIVLLFLPFAVHAEVNKIVKPLPCGIYDADVKPLVEKDLATRNTDTAACTMGITTESGKELSVEIRSVDVKMPGERHQVSVFLDGKPFVKTSHQDVPLYLEVHVDNKRYRIICVRVDEREINPVGPRDDRNKEEPEKEGDKESR
jgi:hypothetical protein